MHVYVYVREIRVYRDKYVGSYANNTCIYSVVDESRSTYMCKFMHV